MKIALFDLDNTLLMGDSDHAWGEWLCKYGILNKQTHKAKNDAFYQDYLKGTLDVCEFLKYSLDILKKTSMKQLNEWRQQFIEEMIKPIILPKGLELIASHKKEGHRVAIITSTNNFITEPIAKLLDIPYLIATECEIIDGRYTGKVAGIPCYQEGKILKLKQWAKTHKMPLEHCYFYSDSKNDLPLLAFADSPVAVDPDDTLRERAELYSWPIISLRN